MTARDFESNLHVLDGLIQRVGDVERTIVSMRVLPGARLLLVVSNIERVWATELALEQFKSHKEKLCIRTLSWTQLFKMIETVFSIPLALTVDNIDNDQGQPLVLGLTYTLSGELQICGEFRVHEVLEATEKNQILADIVFALLKRPVSNLPADSPQLRIAKAEIAILKRKVEDLEVDLARAREDHAAATATSGWDDGFSQLPSSTQHVGGGIDDVPLDGAKRKPPPPKNMSLCNPSQKKRLTRGVKLG